MKAGMMRSLSSGLTAVVMALAMAGPAQAKSMAEVLATYDFYVGGFHIAEVSLNATANGRSYRARSKAVTRGMLDVLLRGRSASESRGMLAQSGRLIPVDFNTLYSSRRGEQKIRIAYEDAKPAKIVMDPKAEEGSNYAGEKDRIGSLDPLSAAVAALLPLKSGDLCNRSIPIFDGKRRFDILFLPPDPERFDPNAPAPEWNKPMTRCLGVYERISGFETPIIEGQQYYPFDIWFEDSGNGVFRAVRVAGNTKLGYAVGNLRPPE